MENYRIVSPEHTEIHESLLRWAAWARVKHHPATCRSLEGNYKPPPMYAEPAPRFTPDHKLVHLMERLIVAAPRNLGQHLIYYYLKRLAPDVVGKKLKLRRDRIVPHLVEAREYIRNHLTT
jgi:hypothetical protein